MRISILDQSPVSEGFTPADALQATLDVARAADRLGITRYWLAEHHNSPAFAGTAPEVLAGIVLANTERMRVGSGGVLLPRYAPAKVAEAFQVLSGLYPDRVDLGVGRAGGPAQDFPERVSVLLDYLHMSPTPGPKVWLLGSSTSSADLAARIGTAYCHAHFLNPASSMDAISRYRSGGGTGPATVAVRAFVADTAADARDLATCFLLWRSRKDLGEDGPLPAQETARSHHWTSAEQARAQAHQPAILAGTPDEIQQQLTALANHHRVEELVVNTLTHDPADRIRSYQLLTEVIDAELPVG